MNISAWAIKNPIPSILLFFMLCVTGLMSFKATNVLEMPDIELPLVTVSTSLEGASPNQMETEVVRKIEDSMVTIGNVKHIFSNITDGAATVFVEFNLEKDGGEAINDVRDALSRIRADLPSELRDPVVSKLNTSGRPILTFSVQSDLMDEQDVSWMVDNEISKVLL
ncbi:MAG: efflux RND transporter permease subunit, partial [Candidatus Nitrotoga sp.]